MLTEFVLLTKRLLTDLPALLTSFLATDSMFTELTELCQFNAIIMSR
ncbi:hypothetical protein [Lactococcus allomyrinae]|nr:hypothetical protein [Lactococcus allomyrinae]